MTNKVDPRTLSGFKDNLPPESILKARVISSLKETLESFGYVPLDTPHLELTECLLGQTSGEIGKQLYRFEDNGKRDVCLRFDLTVPFARALAQHENLLGLPFKRYAVGNVFRGERPQLGRYREFTQCDFDFVGVESQYADCEVLQVVSQILKKLGVNNFLIRINNRQLMNGFFDDLGLSEHSGELLRTIDKFDKVGKDAVSESLTTLVGAEKAAKIVELIMISHEGNNEQTILKLQNIKVDNSDFKIGVEKLVQLKKLLDDSEVKNFKLDLTIARGLGYYTGTVYETFLTDFPEVGSVSSGGRYDNLTATFGSKNTPGVGGSIGLDRILSIADKLGWDTKSKTTAEVLVTLLSESLYPKINNLANTLRASGIAVEIYPEISKLKKQLQYADRKGYQYIVIFGEQEAERGSFRLKNLVTGVEADYSTALEIEKIISLSK